MKAIYLCNTPYHVLISLVKAILDTESSSLVLCESGLIGEKTIRRLQNCGVFSDVKIADMKKESRLKNFLRGNIRSEKRILQLENSMGVSPAQFYNRRVYIFNDETYMGFWLNLRGINYILLEDGLDCFKNELLMKFWDSPTPAWKAFVKKLLGRDEYPKSLGLGEFNTAIEINDEKGILLKTDKEIRVVPRTELFYKLSAEQRNKITQIFLGNDKMQYICTNDHTASLLITQPLAEDHLITFEQKRELYRYLICEYGQGTVYIKPHPREITDYSVEFPECMVINEKYVPIEVFGFIDNIHFKRGITAFSTAIDSLTFCDEKIVMGYDWVKAFINT